MECFGVVNFAVAYQDAAIDADRLVPFCPHAVDGEPMESEGDVVDVFYRRVFRPSLFVGEEGVGNVGAVEDCYDATHSFQVVINF